MFFTKKNNNDRRYIKFMAHHSNTIKLVEMCFLLKIVVAKKIFVFLLIKQDIL